MPDYEWDDNEYPLAYFITIRTYGTWLHGDERKSVDRHSKNLYGTDRIGLDPMYSVKMEQNNSAKPFLLDGARRETVEIAIRDVCSIREYLLCALNVRTNHVHLVVSASVEPNRLMSAFKANATRELREAGLVGSDQKVWSRGGSTRYLWKPRDVNLAIDYTLNQQGDMLPDF
jgi:REP element-mobilizing transposase RayT